MYTSRLNVLLIQSQVLTRLILAYNFVFVSYFPKSVRLNNPLCCALLMHQLKMFFIYFKAFASESLLLNWPRNKLAALVQYTQQPAGIMFILIKDIHFTCVYRRSTCSQFLFISLLCSLLIVILCIFLSLSLHQLQVYAAYKATYSLLIPANKIKIENYMVHSLTER